MTTEAMRAGDAFSGVRVTSPAFAADGTFRRDDLLLKAVATVSCTAEPGSYEVRFGSAADVHLGVEIDRLWGSIRVAPADAAERAQCARQVAARPPESMEERYPAGSGWPSGPWDVRSVEPGGELEAWDGLAMGDDGMVKLTSPGFTRAFVMHGAKLVSATVRIRCDAEPGLYVVHWNEEGRPAREWARYRVTPAVGGHCQDPVGAPRAGAARRAAPWLLAAAAVLAAAGAVGSVVHRRMRRA
ncbi:hypothetical protein [Streptomyces sp. NPDC056491]|uniref:hypothetical protein n=1 Tax=Streptomyces sp. NPDC056491 TaxID=3345837 RepID=UPI0036B35947